jgi:hypothetical protein
MARFTPILGNIAGSIGANTFTRNRYGMVIRRRAVPVNVRSIAQRLTRGILSAASAFWRQVIEPSNTAIAWNAFAANFALHQGKGNKTAVFVTGQAFSVAINSMRSLLGLPAIVSPPQTWGTDQPTSITAACVGATSIIMSAIGGVTPDASDMFLIKCTSPISRGVRFIGKSKFRVIYKGAIAALPMDLTAQYQAVWSNLPATGSVIGLSLQIVKVKTLPAGAGLDTACPGQPVYVRLVAS